MSQSTDPIAAAYEGARISLALGIGLRLLSGPLLEHDVSPYPRRPYGLTVFSRVRWYRP